MNPLTKIFESLAPSQLRAAVHVTGAIVTLLIAAAGYSIGFVSDTNQETTWKNSIESGQELLKIREQIAQDRDIAECELFAMTRRLEELTALIPNNPESSRFLAQLAHLGAESELGIENFRPGPPETTDNMRRIRVQLSGTGRYESICRFLDGLQTLPRLTRVAKLQVDPPGENGLYSVSMDLLIFFAANQLASTKVARND